MNTHKSQQNQVNFTASSSLINPTCSKIKKCSPIRHLRYWMWDEKFFYFIQVHFSFWTLADPDMVMKSKSCTRCLWPASEPFLATLKYFIFSSVSLSGNWAFFANESLFKLHVEVNRFSQDSVRDWNEIILSIMIQKPRSMFNCLNNYQYLFNRVKTSELFVLTQYSHFSIQFSGTSGSLANFTSKATVADYQTSSLSFLLI